MDENRLTNEQVIDIIRKQLEQTHESHTQLEKNLAEAIKQPSKPTEPAKDKTQCTGDKKQPKVILFHDSLCKEINETMSRESVQTKKIWAPTLPAIQENINPIDDEPDVL